MKYGDKVKPVVNIVRLGKRGQYERKVVTCGICGNVLHPYRDYTFCPFCRYSIDWECAKITRMNYKVKHVRVDEKAYKKIY